MGEGHVMPRVLVIAEAHDRLREVAELLRNHAEARGQALEVLAVHGLGEAAWHLRQYINLVVLPGLGLPVEKVVPLLTGLRRVYAGPVVVAHDGETIDACAWGRRYGADYHAPTLKAIPGCVERALSRPRVRGKTAIVFAGGAILGGFHEAGSLKALYDFGVRDFDMYVGLSAGSWVAALAANGVTPELMIEHPDLTWRDFYHLNRAGLWGQATRLGPNLLKGLAQRIVQPDSDWFFRLSSMLTTSPLSGDRLRERFLDVLDRVDGTNDFAELREAGRDLYIMAVNLDTAERRVFGAGDDVHVPIADAVMASSALPLFYRPVAIDGQDYVDGGLARSACIDTAIEYGADLIVCVNPLVPYTGGEPGHITRLGLAGIAEQSVRALIHSRLHATLDRYRHIHPHVTIILIEPDPAEPTMFHNPLRGSEAMIQRAALEGFKATKRRLQDQADFIARAFADHGRPLIHPAARPGADAFEFRWRSGPNEREIAT